MFAKTHAESSQMGAALVKVRIRELKECTFFSLWIRLLLRRCYRHLFYVSLASFANSKGGVSDAVWHPESIVAAEFQGLQSPTVTRKIVLRYFKVIVGDNR